MDNYIFDLDENVTRTPVSYKNRYGITIAADLYRPKDFDEDRQYPAIVIGPPYSGVKEQGPGIYAQQLAKRGFVALAFDPSYNGYSGGEPRHASSPDIFAEDFSAGVDFLGTRPFVDRERIGGIGICGSGGFALSAAQVDRRIKAVVTAALVDINLFDTADVYGGPQTPDMAQGFGLSEEIIGRWLGQGAGRREQIVLATKVYQPMGPGPNDKYLSAYRIRKAAEASLRRLNTDHVDLYQMHHVDRETPWDEIWQAMEQLVREGKVTYIGSSNFAGWQIATAQSTAAARNFFGLVSEQSLYNLTARTIELEVIPALRYYGLGLIPWSPLGGGLLGGVLQKIQDGRRATPQMAADIERHRPQLEAYEKLCADLGEQPADVALAWLLHNPVLTATIAGPRTPEQLAAAQPALDVKLSPETLRQLDEIWPGPGGEAPEAYAW